MTNRAATRPNILDYYDRFWEFFDTLGDFTRWIYEDATHVNVHIYLDSYTLHLHSRNEQRPMNRNE